MIFRQLLDLADQAIRFAFWPVPAAATTVFVPLDIYEDPAQVADTYADPVAPQDNYVDPSTVADTYTS